MLSVGAFLSGDYETCADEIEEIKAATNNHPLKVILETGALQTAENIKKASILSMYAGADFIKTSTGKVEPAATLEAAFVMCTAIKEYHELTGNLVGFKAAGGIKTWTKRWNSTPWYAKFWARTSSSRASSALVRAAWPTCS